MFPTPIARDSNGDERSETRFRYSNVSVSSLLFIAVILLGMLLTVSNILLVAKNRVLSRKLRAVIMSNFAPVGATLPVLSGKLPDGTAIAVDPVGSAPLLLMVFEPTCAICDQNWPNWAKLTADPQITRQCLLISGSSSIPVSYLQDHHSGRRGAILGVAPDILRSFNLLSTPQTILVEKGKIVGTWPGVLSEADVQDIRNGLIRISEAYK